MAPSEPDQNMPHDACDIASCFVCGQRLATDTMQLERRDASGGRDWTELPELERAQLITSTAWSETARDPNVLLLCGDCHRDVDGAESPDVSFTRPLIEHVWAPLDAAAVLLKPTREQVLSHGDLHAGNIMPPDREARLYLIDFALPAATFTRWHELAHWSQGPEFDAPARLVAADSSREGRSRLKAALAVAAARAAWAAAVHLRELYLSPDLSVSLTDRHSAVIEFATTWLGWRANVPQSKIDALIDALLSDEWPSEHGEPDDNVPTVLGKLVGHHYRHWRTYDVDRIRGKSVISHSIQVRTESGEPVELIERLPGPDVVFAVEPHVALVRRMLAELDPVEREVCLTYATCTGRKGWHTAAQLNGMPAEFGVNRVRRKIKARLAQHERAGRTGRRAIGG